MGSRVVDKNRRLRRYGRKDYTQVVDFPVEIVGRDGVVRRYSFEELLRQTRATAIPTLRARRLSTADDASDSFVEAIFHAMGGRPCRRMRPASESLPVRSPRF